MRNARIDWSKIVWDIVNNKMGVSAIARHCYASRTSVVYWRDRGREPRGYIACRRLLLLWQEKAGGNPEEPPYV